MSKLAQNYDVCNDIICVDSTGGIDRVGYRLFAFVVPFVTGAVAISLGICTNEQEETLGNLFKKMKMCAGNLMPDCIMTDDSAAERQALKAVFETSTLLLCQFHILSVFFSSPFYMY